MSFSVPPPLPHGLAHSASSPTTGTQPTPRATTQSAHSDLVSRQREPGDTDASLAPRKRLAPPRANAPGTFINSMLQHTSSALQRFGEKLARPYMATPPLHAFSSPPKATQPYRAPSADGLQRVSFSAQMTPEDARAALLAMDISPQFLNAMKADLNHCTNPYSAGWSADSPRQFVATYGQLVAMPNGLDTATVAALYRMLASPEPATPPTPTLPTRAQAAQPQQQTLPFMEMTIDDARAALQAMEVAPQTLARMTKDLLICVETNGSPVGQECARHFQHEYGHLLAMPPHLGAAALTRLVNLLMDQPEAQPQAEPQVEPHAALPLDTPAPQAQGLALHAMEPAEAMQALLALNVPEQQLLAMAQDLTLLDDALKDEDGDDQVQELTRDFVQNHGHLIELPTRVQSHTLRAIAQMLVNAAPEED